MDIYTSCVQSKYYNIRVAGEILHRGRGVRIDENGADGSKHAGFQRATMEPAAPIGLLC